MPFDTTNSTFRGLVGISFAAFAIAGAALLGAVVFADFTVYAAPLIFLILLVALGLGGVLLLGLQVRGTTAIAAAAMCLIDFGFGRFQNVVLGLKGGVYVLCFLLGMQYLLSRRRAFNTSIWLMMAYALFAWGTVVYSASPWTTAYTGFALFALAVISARVASLERKDVDRMVDVIGMSFGLMLAASMALYVVAPQIAVATEVAGTGRVAGLYGSPNSAGGVAGLALLINLSRVLWPNGRSVGALVASCLFATVALAALALSGSRNAAASAAFGTLLLLVLRWRISAVMALVAVAVGALVMTVLSLWSDAADAIVSMVSRTRSGGDVRNLTGRTAIWDFVWKSWQSSPIFGYGLGSTRAIISEGWATVWGKTTATAHNALLESLLDLGVLGSVLVFGLVASVVRDLVRGIRYAGPFAPNVSLAFGVMAFVIIFGLAEKSFAGTPSTSTGALFIVAAIAAAALRRPTDEVAEARTATIRAAGSIRPHNRGGMRY